jgi:peptidoglycan/xylan/chitin deacetylase (PgdA/CDA1 family)
MNRKIALTLLVASFAAGSAFAETPMTDITFKATMTRDQVQAELQRYRSAGVDILADGYDHLREFRSTRTRAEVLADFMAARDMVTALNGEDSGARYLTRRQMPRKVGPQLAALPGSDE